MICTYETTGPALRIKHLQGRLVGVFCLRPGRRRDFEDN